MGIFDRLFGKRKQSKLSVADQYKLLTDSPASIETEVEGHKMFKRDMTGLFAYFKERPDMERLYNEFTHLIRNELTVSEYLNGANVMDDLEVRSAVKKGFGDIAGFLKDMLEIQDNEELRKDFNACKEAVSILKGETSEAEDYFQESFKNRDNEDFHLAIENISKAIAIDPTKGVYYFNRAAVKQTMFDYESAILDFTKSIDLKFEHLEAAYFYRAKCKIYIQDIKGAKVDTMKLMELGHLEWVEQFEYWIDSFEELGYDEFIKTFPF